MPVGAAFSGKMIDVAFSIECDPDVTPDMVRAILQNHMYWALRFTMGGIINWSSLNCLTVENRKKEWPTHCIHGRQIDSAGGWCPECKASSL